jgi:hypothetical protein
MYMLLPRHHNACQNRYIIIADRSCQMCHSPNFFEATVRNQNLIQKEIKWRLNSGNACYHSVQNLLSARLLSRNVKDQNIQDDNFACGSVWV